MSFTWNTDPFIAEAQKLALKEAARDLLTRFNPKDYHPKEETFVVGWIQAAYEIHYLATGVEPEWGESLADS